MSLAETLAADRRLLLLASLAEGTGYALNEGVLRRALAELGHEAPRDLVRADLTWLSEHALVVLTPLATPSGPLWTARLTPEGKEVAEGRRHPGVRRPDPFG